MINFTEAFKEATFDLMTNDEKQNYIFGNPKANTKLRGAAEQYKLIKNVNELSKTLRE